MIGCLLVRMDKPLDAVIKFFLVKIQCRVTYATFSSRFQCILTLPLTWLQGIWAVPRVLRSQFPSWWSLCVRWRWRSPPRTTAGPWTNTRSWEWRPRTGPGDTRLPSALRERKITLVTWSEWSVLHIRDLIHVSELNPLTIIPHYTPQQPQSLCNITSAVCTFSLCSLRLTMTAVICWSMKTRMVTRRAGKIEAR